MSQEERAGAGVIKHATIVALNCLDGGAVLSGHMNKEVSQSRELSDFRRKGKVHKRCEQSSRMTK